MPGIEYMKHLTGYYNVTGYGWIIDTDHLSIEYQDSIDDTGTAGPSNITDEITNGLNKGAGIPFKIYDDDGELYYSGRIIVPKGEEDGEMMFRPLSDFGEPNAGATEIRYEDDKGEWKAL